MKSILDRDRYLTLPFEQRRDLNAFERSAHRLALSIFNYAASYLTPSLRDKAVNVVVVGLISALARIIAENRRHDDGRAYIEGLAAILPSEFQAWADRTKEPADLRH